ncbi:MAG TPA: site-2 protease family protein [Candidatus Pacearchaeota archaeon]|nr:site-2 protease family protein [Candidatus Pacearchaeota archaeon]HPR80018.1 site-2 protease family protein [Candidatus Pacearchaeota archaeon]
MDTLTIFTLLILLFSIIIHEIAHGSVAYALGDPTAKEAGRLDLNPLKHLDPIGSILLPFFMSILGGPIIGWAKPVPINPMYFSDRRWGELKVALAGPVANFTVALIFGLIVKFVHLPDSFLTIATVIIFYNIALGIFNLIPIFPLDGSHVLFALLPERFEELKVLLTQYGFILLLFLIFIIPNGLSWVFTLSDRILSLFLA